MSLVDTVNWKIFARVSFRKTLQMRSFVKIKLLRNGEITLLFTDAGKSCPSCDFLMSQICFNAICENEILAKNSKFLYTMNARKLHHNISQL